MTALRLRGLRAQRHIRLAEETQHLQGTDLAEHQRDRLGMVIQAGVRHSQVFANIIPYPTFGEDVQVDLGAFATMPILEKHDLAAMYPEISAYVQRSRAAIEEKHTSGSTGRPLRILKDRDGVAAELGATWRAYGWLGIELGNRGVRVWGRPLSWRQKLTARFKAALLNMALIDAFDVTDKALSQRVTQIQRVRPKYIYGYASSVADIARFMNAENLEPPRTLKAVITTAEPLSDGDRADIHAGLGVWPSDEYGASEVGSIAHECKAGYRHIMADHLLLEIIGADGTISREGTGELLVSDLTNVVTPVIRYRLGDYVTIRDPGLCACGLTLPLLTDIRGRVEDAVVTPDGSRHHPARVCYIVEEALKGRVAIEKYQVVQTSPRQLQVNIVAATITDTQAITQQANRLFKRYLHPDVTVTVFKCQEINRETSGKYSLVKNVIGRRGQDGE